MSYLEPVDTAHEDVAAFYDELPLWSAPFGLKLLDRVPLRPGLQILDVGAGTGYLTIELAQRCGSMAHVIAVDRWGHALSRLRRRLGYLSLDNVTVIEADAAALNLPDASIDLVASNLGINNFDNVDAVLKTIFRITKPGAALLLTTNLAGHMAEFYDVFQGALMALGQEDRLPVLQKHVAHRGTVDTVQALLNQAGFVVTEVEQEAFRMRFVDGSALLRHYLIRLGFLPAWTAVATPDRVEETFAAVERNLNLVAERKGELSLTIPAALFVAKKPI
jgi:ubiquinone/menaquinone biosynthesis C-methylase UbiE